MMNQSTIIVGGGPAGLQLAYFLEKANRNYILLEKSDRAGNTFTAYPRHRKLISINKVFTGEVGYDKNMRWDWNSLLTDEEDLKKQPLFSSYTKDYFPNADVLVQYLGDFARAFALKIAYNTEVKNISKEGKTFTVRCSGEKTYTTECLVVATGFWKTNIPDIPGIELVQNYEDMNINPIDYANQEVLVIGKGNSGFETADNLIHTTALIHVLSPDPLALAWKTHYIGDLRAVNNDFIDTYQLKSQNAVLDATIEKITRAEDGKFDCVINYQHALGEREVLAYDAVLNCTGFVFDSDFYDASCMPNQIANGKFPELKSNWESTNVEGLFFTGVLSHSIDYKKHTSGFIHGFRYCVRTLFHLLEQRYYDVAYPRREIPASVEGVLNAIIARAGTTSGLWQQFGYLNDVVTIQDDHAFYYEELTKGLIRDSDISTFAHYYTFSLEFNKVDGDPFEIHRKPVPGKAQESIFLHPVVRQFNKGKLMNELHLLEDLYTNWTHPTQHIQPLREFLTACFQGRIGFQVATPIQAKM